MLVWYAVRGQILDITTYYIDGHVNSTDAHYMDRNIIVASSGVFVVPEIVLTGTRVLENNGVVDTDITVCENCKLEILNRGIFNADFTLADGASVVQIVSDESDMMAINIDVNYDLLVRNANEISLADVISFGNSADEIVFSDSLVIWDVNEINVNNITLVGDIRLDVSNIESLLNGNIPLKMDAGARVQIMSGERENSMFALVPYTQNSNVYARFIRETDYTKFLDYRVGAYINSLRDSGVADDLLYGLDNALSMRDIDEIMADSVRIAPINLMRSIAILNTLDMNNYMTGLRGDVMTFVGDDVYAYGIMLNHVFDFMNVNLGVRGYINAVGGTDGYDEFSGGSLGANLYAYYKNDIGFIRGMLGANVTRFEIADVFDGTDSVDNPVGYSMYGGMDMGRVFNFDNGIYVAPYVGVTANAMEILHQNESDYFGRVGMDAGYAFDVLGIKYDYSLRANIDSGANVFVGGRFGFMVDVDMIGGHAEVGYIDGETGRGYKITAGIDLKF